MSGMRSPPRPSATTIAFVFSAMALVSPAMAADGGSHIPDLSGQWLRVNLRMGGQITFDPTKPWGLGQQAPLTPEYQKILEASVADQAGGGQGNWPTGADCLPPGMPAMMTAFQAMEIIVLPETTYVRIDHAHDSHRRIYTDGREWPKDVEPSFMGYSIGHWIDENHDGRFTLLEVETRFLRGPRALDPAGMPVSQEEKLRGGDRKIAGALMIETLYQDRAEAVGAELAKQFTSADIGVFRVLCHIGRSDL